MSPGFKVKYGVQTRMSQYTEDNNDYSFLFNRKTKADPVVKRWLKAFRLIFFFIKQKSKLLGRVYSLQIKLENWLKRRLKSVSIAQPDVGLIDAVEKAFPDLAGKLPRKLKISYKDIMSWDNLTMITYGLPKRFKVSDPEAFIKAMKGTYNALGFSKFKMKQVDLSMISRSEAIEKLPTNTSSCYPIFKKKSHVESIKNAFHFVDELFNTQGTVNKYVLFCNYPTVIFHRLAKKLGKSFGLYNVVTKIRLVFGMSFGIVLFETMMFEKILNFIRNFGYGHSIGYTREQISEQVKKIRLSAIRRGMKIFCTDISGMDKNLPGLWIMLFFGLLISVIRPSVSIVPNVVALACYHVFTPMLSSRLDLVVSDGGNKSGSKLTTYLNTFCVVTAIHYTFLRREGRLPSDDEFAVVGDDSIFLVRDNNVPKVIEDFKELGMTVSKSKSSVCSPNNEMMFIVYLGFYWDLQYRPNQNALWWIARCCYPERFFFVEKGESVRLLRLASVLYQIVGGHSIFCKIMKCLGFNLNDLFSKDPRIYYLDKQGRTHLGVIPLSELRRRGWACY